jgi:TRAP-type mannitol/chloroaromatic compound transport system substrate-binding protein
MTSEYMWGNAVALEQLKADQNIKLNQIPQAVFDQLREHARAAINDLINDDALSKKIQDSMSSFINISSSNQEITELAYLKMRINSSAL